jgi:hypothetical protein
MHGWRGLEYRGGAAFLSMFIPRFVRHSIFAAALLLPALSHATLVINNLAAGTQGFALSLSGPAAEFFPGEPFNDRQVAFSFTTGADAVFLSNVSFSINIGDPSLSPVELTLSTGSVVPGGTGAISLGSVAPLSPTPGVQLLSLAPTSVVTLNPSTEYWMHFTVPAGAGIYAINNSNTPVFAPGWSMGNSWAYDPDFGGSWSELANGTQARVSIDVQTVPEPTTAMLGAAGMFCLLRRRRQ